MVTAAILHDYDLVKLQFNMQAVQIAQSSGPVHQGGEYSLLIGGSQSSGRGWCGWVSSILYDPVQHVNIDIQEEKMAISLHLHSELNVLMDIVHTVNKGSLSASL
jgi:hypothetical protein